MKGEVPLTFVLRNISFCTFKRKGRNEKVFLFLIPGNKRVTITVGFRDRWGQVIDFKNQFITCPRDLFKIWFYDIICLFILSSVVSTKRLSPYRYSQER